MSAKKTSSAASPLISIVMPVYNVEGYLPMCMDTIRRQTYQNIQIITVLDGCTDRSETILRLYQQVEPRLVIIKKEHGGPSSARNAGIDAAEGDIVMFVDSDDLVVSEMCEKVVAAFAQDNPEVVTFGGVGYPCFGPDPWLDVVLAPRNVFYPEFSPDILFKEASHPYPWRTAVKRSFFERTGLRFDEDVVLGEDQVFHFALYPKAKGVKFISDRLYEYRTIRRDSLMAQKFRDRLGMLTEHLNFTRIICENWRADGLMETAGTELLAWAADFLIPDILREPDEVRVPLIPKMQELFATQFSEEHIMGLEEGPLKEACIALIVGDGDATIAAKELETTIQQVPAAVLDQAGARRDPTEGMDAGGPEWRKNLRVALPMSAEGLERRLKILAIRINEVGNHMDDVEFHLRCRIEETERKFTSGDVARWLTEESSACTRSLEMLRLEILAKNGLIQF